ncbi:conjugal transfer relaxase TraA [Acinetobacter baumannii]|nr:conjugal transfer relaxase TraA [Acinetobacter baumannii]
MTTAEKTGVEYKEIYLPEGAPEHLKNREKLWNEVEQRETPKKLDCSQGI